MIFNVDPMGHSEDDEWELGVWVLFFLGGRDHQLRCMVILREPFCRYSSMLKVISLVINALLFMRTSEDFL